MAGYGLENETLIVRPTEAFVTLFTKVEYVPKLVGDLGEKQAGGIRSWYRSVGQATPTPADIKPLAIPGQILYPRTVRALISYSELALFSKPNGFETITRCGTPPKNARAFR